MRPDQAAADPDRKRPTGASTSTVAAGSTPTPKVAGTCPPRHCPRRCRLRHRAQRHHRPGLHWRPPAGPTRTRRDLRLTPSWPWPITPARRRVTLAAGRWRRWTGPRRRPRDLPKHRQDGEPGAAASLVESALPGVLRIDAAALQRGRVEGEELCEIAGIGPVPVSVARTLLGEAIVKLVITNGVDVANVTHLGRGRPPRRRSHCCGPTPPAPPTAAPAGGSNTTT